MVVDGINYTLPCYPSLSPKDHLRRSQLDIRSRVKTKKSVDSVTFLLSTTESHLRTLSESQSILTELTVFPHHLENYQISLGDNN